MFTLETFGGLSLRGPDGPITGRVGQRRRLALLAVLAAEGRPLSRDKLLAFLWPEANSERARHLLADSLYVLRAGLGDDALQTFGDDVTLNEQVVASDVSVFLAAIHDEDPERAAGAYRGAFLDGIFISDAPEFERWAESTRSRLEVERRRCLERLASEADARQDRTGSVKWWRAVAAADPVSSRAAVGLMRALSAAGDRGAALQFARVHEELVHAELGSAADPTVAALVRELRAATEHVRDVAPRSENGAARPEASPVVPANAALKPGSIFTEARHPAPAIPWRRRASLPAIGASIVFVAVVGTILYANKDRPSSVRGCVPATREADAPPSIAVLPFQPISSDREADYIADGVTDALTTELDRLHQMRIVSKTSAVYAKQSGASTPVIGEMLHAPCLLEGSVRLAGNQMRIESRLVSARDGSLLWSKAFVLDFSPPSVMTVEDTIARSIAATLNVRLADSASRLTRHAPANVEALDAYAHGRFFLNSRNPDGVRKSIEYFSRALEQDSNFAAAQAGLADAYAAFAIGNIGDFKADEYFPRSRDAARRALFLDSTLAEAYASLGYFELLYQLDWAAAARELSRGVERQPSYPLPHIYRAILAEWTGHYADGVSEAQTARDLDPLSPAANIELGRAFFFDAKYDEAEKQLRRTLDLDSTSLRAHMHLGQVLAFQRHFHDGIQELKTAARLSTNSSRPLALLAHAYAAAGQRDDALALLDSLRVRGRRGYVPAFDFAIVHAGLGDRTQAIDYLNRAVDDHSIRPYLMDPTFDGIRSDARFRQLLTRLRLPTEAPKR